MQFMGEKIRKVKEYRARHEVEVCEMETKTKKALEDLRVDLVRFLPEESLYVIVRYLMGKFDKLREREESLGEVLTLKMQENKAMIEVIEKIRDIQKKTDMQGWNKYGTTKLKFHLEQPFQ